MFLRLIVLLVVLTGPTFARCAEIVVLSSVGARSAMEELGPLFEQLTGNRVRLQYDTAVALKKQIDAGTSFDVTLLTESVMAALASEKKVAENQRTFARSFIGLAGKSGAVKPPLATNQEFIDALLAADKIAFAKEGASGLYFQKLIQKLELSDQLKDKLLPLTGSKEIEAVAEGRATYGVQLISEILPVKGVDLIGAFPDDLQNVTELQIGYAPDSRAADTAKEFITFVTSGSAATVVRKVGMTSP